VRKLTFVADYFVLCTGFNPRQLQSIADESVAQVKAQGSPILGIEGYASARWILVDFGDVIFHLFDRDAREFYDLELLWGDAPKVKWEPAPSAVRTVRRASTR
jgi:ribosome-associated protein